MYDFGPAKESCMYSLDGLTFLGKFWWICFLMFHLLFFTFFFDQVQIFLTSYKIRMNIDFDHSKIDLILYPYLGKMTAHTTIKCREAYKFQAST